MATGSSIDGDDDELVVTRIALDRCSASLRVLIDRHSGKVTGWLKKRFKSLKEQEIDWVVNMTFLKIWRKAHLFNSLRGKFESWLFRIAFRCAESVRKKEEKHLIETLSEDVVQDSDEERENEEGGNDNESAEVIADRRDWRVRELRRFIDGLKGNERVVAERDLEECDGVDNDRLADELGTSRRSIIQTRSNYRRKYRDRVAQIEANRASGKGRI